MRTLLVYNLHSRRQCTHRFVFTTKPPAKPALHCSSCRIVPLLAGWGCDLDRLGSFFSLQSSLQSRCGWWGWVESGHLAACVRRGLLHSQHVSLMGVGEWGGFRNSLHLIKPVVATSYTSFLDWCGIYVAQLLWALVVEVCAADELCIVFLPRPPSLESGHVRKGRWGSAGCRLLSLQAEFLKVE